MSGQAQQAFVKGSINLGSLYCYRIFSSWFFNFLTHTLLQRRSWAPITKYHEDGVRISFPIFDLMSSLFLSYIYFQHKKKLTTPKWKQPKFILCSPFICRLLRPCGKRALWDSQRIIGGHRCCVVMVLSALMGTLIHQDQVLVAARSASMLLFLGRSQNMQQWILKQPELLVAWYKGVEWGILLMPIILYPQGYQRDF